MAKQAESKLSRNMIQALRLEGAFCFKVHGSALMMAGLPDIIGVVKGRFFALETKMPDKANNTSPRQDYVHSLIKEAGGAVTVVTTVDQAVAFVQSIK